MIEVALQLVQTRGSVAAGLRVEKRAGRVRARRVVFAHVGEGGSGYRLVVRSWDHLGCCGEDIFRLIIEATFWVRSPGRAKVY